MFAHPWLLLLLLLVPFAAWRVFARRSQPGIRFSSVGLAKQLRPTLRQRLAWLPPALTIAALVFLIIAIARPREGRSQTFIDSEGIAIEIVIDRSGSMLALDFKLDGENVDRLTAIKNVVTKFVNGSDDLEGRVSDLVGLVSFAGYADAKTPPTLDHQFLVNQLDNTEIVNSQAEDGTAIGDAISLAVEKLVALDNRQKDKVKSKIIILLTDGENNAGDMDPVQAAELAQTLDVKIYTIGVGTKGQAPVPVIDRFSGRKFLRMIDVNIDEDTLTKVAQATGGKYFRAVDTDSLENIYREIDALEKTKVEAQHYVDYRELAVQDYRVAGFSIPPLLLLAFLLLLLRWVLQETWLRELS